MKKILLLCALSLGALISQAASFNWSATMIYASDGTTRYAGAVTLYCAEVSDWSASATANNGVIAKTATTFSSDKFSAGNTYNFYFVVSDNGKEFRSASVPALAQQSDVATIAFGNMQTATQNASNWGAVPEPTSALLMVLGVAGLALRRRRV